MYRLIEHAPEYGLDAQGAGGAGAGGAGAAPKSAARLRLEARIQELQEELRRKKEEVAKRQEMLFAKCKDEFSAALNAREQELLEVQGDATFDAARAHQRSAEAGRAAEAQRRFT